MVETLRDYYDIRAKQDWKDCEDLKERIAKENPGKALEELEKDLVHMKVRLEISTRQRDNA